MEANYVHKDSTTLVQDELVKNELNQIELQYNALKQQKEFIEYMNKTIEELECDDVDDEEIKGYLIQRIDTFKEILQKYKSIIGDINAYMKSKDDLIKR